MKQKYLVIELTKDEQEALYRLEVEYDVDIKNFVIDAILNEVRRMDKENGIDIEAQRKAMSEFHYNCHT